MVPLFRVSLAFMLALGLSASAANAATTADQLVALARAGLDDDILIALIQTDGSIFYLTADDILELHRQGLSNRVILAMQQTAMITAPPTNESAAYVAPATAPESLPAQASFSARPPVAIPPAAGTTFRPFAGPVSNVNAVTVAEPAVVETPAAVEVLVPVAVPGPVRTHGHAPGREESSPVYWGWGGQRRPDSWSPGPASSGRASAHETHGTPRHESKDSGKKDR